MSEQGRDYTERLMAFTVRRSHLLNISRVRDILELADAIRAAEIPESAEVLDYTTHRTPGLMVLEWEPPIST